MSRRPLSDVVMDIRKVLEKKGELSVKAIAEEVDAQWITTIKALELLKDLGIVTERYGKETYKKERLFKLR